ncbi:MFS transporter, DHA1 family, bicyclomycin/chloramphenicol resistance protein [Agrococcus baldri]|uniref:MFS transporter, DHA1 family, bicyclomycin/chloramphenicol resistance protein n=1 Tax=Agrococcus baldri TaxID=153730 RepID=A0AA94HL87_9MICO|nr:multidrug effflux MFS transporter [Agrococcus baldri]SFS06713.1 MFS transporter, DHA1 family, bicyclomycin/chloramphenicol resistance protein [Agrococcus baldri]
MSSAPGAEFGRRRRVTTLIVLGLLAGLGPFTIDLYLPAFPAVKDDFGTTDAVVQLTLSATTLGFAFGQLVMGPLSDRVGRRRPLLVATVVHVLASVAVAMAPDIVTLMLMRVVQGFGAAAGTVVAMAMVRDLFGGKQLTTALSRLALVIGIAPIAAPVIGSWLVGFLHWRGLFWVLAAYAVLVIVLQLLFLRETLPPHLRQERGHSTLGQRYRAVLTDRVFIGVVIIGASIFGGMFAYISTASLLLQEVYGFTPGQFGLVFALCSVGVLIGTQTAGRAANRFGPQWVLAVSTALLVISAACIVALDMAGLGIAGLVPPLAVFAFAFGLSMPCVQTLALVGHSSEAGTAASLLGACNMSIAGLVSPIVGLFSIENAIPMGTIMFCCGVLATVSLWFVVRPRTVPTIE